MGVNQNLIACSYKEGVTRDDVHFHNAYEMAFIVSGKMKVLIEEKEYIVRENQIVFIDTRQMHHFDILEGPCSRYFLHLNTEQFGRLLRNPALLSILRSQMIGMDHCIDIGRDAEEIKKVFRQIKKENENPNSFCYEEMITSYIKQILIIAARNIGVKKQEDLVKMRKDIYRIQRELEEHYAEDIKICMLADKYYINQYYLSHCFKRIAGCSPKKYLLLVRISKAKELLLETDFLVSEIAFKTGFGDTNNFIRYFKKEVNMTPNKYRKSIRAKEVKVWE